MADIAKKFERLAHDYAVAKQMAEEARAKMDALRAELAPILSRPDEVRDEIYARMMKYKLGPGASVHTSHAMLSLSSGPESVQVLDIERVPDNYIRQKEPEVNKAEVLKAWRERGKKIPGTKVVTGQPVLSIRV